MMTTKTTRNLRLAEAEARIGVEDSMAELTPEERLEYARLLPQQISYTRTQLKVDGEQAARMASFVTKREVILKSCDAHAPKTPAAEEARCLELEAFWLERTGEPISLSRLLTDRPLAAMNEELLAGLNDLEDDQVKAQGTFNFA
jgi:hypothetical protein